MSELPEGIIRTPEGIHVLRDDTHLSRWIEEHKRLDIAAAQIKWFEKHIPVGGTVVDAGASLGDHTLTYARLVGETGEVLAFEPHPLTFEALKRNFENIPWVHSYNYALADAWGTAALWKDPNIGASHMAPAFDKMLDGDLRNESVVSVDCTSLDVFLPEDQRCDFIHLDVEGYEIKALRGARQLLAREKPVIVLEVNHECLGRLALNEHDVAVALDELGYRWEEIEPGHGPHLPQRDIIAFPK